MTIDRLILILGDQLTPTVASLRAGDPARDRVLMVEVMEEATYVPHHPKKIAFLFSAMRHFAEELRGLGWQVDYVTLDDPDNSGSFSGEIARAAARLEPAAIVVTEPGEWRVLEAMRGWQAALGVPVRILGDDRFLCSIDSFRAWADGRRQLRMEFFYRDMRRRTGLLMTAEGEPEGGQWNYDADNRKPAPRGMQFPEPYRVAPDAITRAVLDLVGARFGHHFGTLEPFWFAVTRPQAEAAFEHFLACSLARFGDYQDAMLRDERFLFHALVSPYLNCGLLDPLQLCRRVESAWRAGAAPLNAAEGFIRQILGWREYVRGIYWLSMPGYVERNHLDARRPLPWFYWSAETDMACVRACVTQTAEEAYAHHIQRLMVTGTFALIAGIRPQEVHEWYLAVYADAYEWVELPNTLGMSQFADGGLLASKPYAASGAYINRMSDYCKGCAYDVEARTGPGACPFNLLYWDFLARNRDRLGGNPRLGNMYRTYDKLPQARRDAIAADAAAWLARLDAGARV